jgi:hypothetical protein
MNMDLARYIIDAVDRYWAEDVQILGAWQDGPAAICVVYRRTIDPMMTLGCKLEFHSDSADGTIEGFARAVAVNLAEPIGTARSRQDQHGIVGWPSPRTAPHPCHPSRSYKNSPAGKLFLRLQAAIQRRYHPRATTDSRSTSNARLAPTACPTFTGRKTANETRVAQRYGCLKTTPASPPASQWIDAPWCGRGGRSPSRFR